MATHSSILTWRIPWTEEPDGLQSMGSQRADTTDHRAHTKVLNRSVTSYEIKIITLKSSCKENPRLFYQNSLVNSI